MQVPDLAGVARDVDLSARHGDRPARTRRPDPSSARRAPDDRGAAADRACVAFVAASRAARVGATTSCGGRALRPAWEAGTSPRCTRSSPPPPASEYPSSEFTAAYEEAEHDGDRDDDRRPASRGPARPGRRRRGDRPGHRRHPRLRARSTASIAMPDRRRAGRLGSPTWCSRAWPRASASARADAGARAGRRSSPPTGRRWPRGRPPPARHRRALGAARRRRRSTTPAASSATRARGPGFPRGSLTGTSGLELAFNDRLDGQPGGAAARGPRGTEATADGAACSPAAEPRARASRSRRRSTPTSRRRRSRRSADSSAASPCSTPATARCWRWRGSPSRPRSRRARPSR